MSTTIFKYPLDLYGTAVSNKVVGEEHEIGARTNRIFASDYGPFFGSSAVVRDKLTGRQLNPQLEYTLLHAYEEAQDRTGQAVYAAVRIINPDVSNFVLFDCQYVGGEFSYSYYAIVDAIRALSLDNRTVNWGDLVGVPSQFPPTAHMHNIYDTYGWKTMIDVVADIPMAIREGAVATMELFKQQINQKFTEVDDFMNALADCYQEAAYELSLL